MTDNITPLPNNGENYFRKAINALEDNRIEAGIYYLKESYQLETKLETFEELVRIYLSIEDKIGLEKIWITSGYTFEEILNSSVLSGLYVLSLPLIKANQEGLLELYQIKDQNYHLDKSIVNESMEKINEIVSLEKHFNSLTDSMALQEYITRLKKLSSIEFLKKLKNIYQLDFNKVNHLYFEILKDKNILNFIKNDILHYLINLDINLEFEYTWFEEKYQLNLNQLTSYRQDPFYQSGSSFICDSFSKNNPHFLEAIMELYNLYAMVYYPFMEKGFQNMLAWLDWISEGKSLSTTSAPKHYYQRAAKEIAQLMGDFTQV